MSLFSRFRKSPEPGVRQWDPTDDPDIARLRVALQRFQWPEVKSHFAGLRDSADRGYTVNSITTWEGRPECFDRWVEAEPKAALPRLLRGAHSVQWAWEARTGSRAHEVQQDAWPIFFKRLQEAQADLECAAEFDPTDPTPYGPLISVAMGLQLESAVVKQRLNAARKLDPDHDWSHAAALWYLCQKWHGSHETMFAYAREVCQKAPEGSPLHVLMTYAHFERWFYALAFDGDEELTASYWNSRLVHDEILTAYRNSLASPKYRVTKQTPNYRNFFALCLARVGEQELARREFKLIGPLFGEFPWRCFGQPRDVFVKHRSLAGL